MHPPPWFRNEHTDALLGKTCADLAAAFPNMESGHYYLDPNEGHPSDAILAFCNMETKETCIHPAPMEVST